MAQGDILAVGPSDNFRVTSAGVASGTFSGALTGSATSLAAAGRFISAETTGTGSAQNVAHGLGVIPSAVIIAPTEYSGTGAFDIAEGTHTTTNIVVTVTSGLKFKVLALV
jgi:hypothetical protein